jgi:hypothetical protein
MILILLPLCRWTGESGRNPRATLRASRERAVAAGVKKT